jgi:hypothetical protein
MPHERSRQPSTAAGATASASPAARSDPSQVPNWVKRVESISSRPCSRRTKRGSSTATLRARKRRSASMPHSLGSTVRRSVRIGSSIATAIGPTRSSPSASPWRDAWSECWWPLRTTLNDASTIPRLR